MFLIKTSIYGGIRGVTDSKRGWYKSFWPFGLSYIFEGASIYGAQRYVVGGLQSTSYNHKNQTLIFKNLKELQK